jgi:hypothetical protein
MDTAMSVQPRVPVSADPALVALHLRTARRAMRAVTAVPEIDLPEVDLEWKGVVPEPVVSDPLPLGVSEAVTNDAEENGCCVICGEPWVCSFYRRMGVTP